MLSKKFVNTYLSIVFSVLMINIISIYVFDPLQFFRKADWYFPNFSTEERYQNPGLAKNYDYDTIILGSSMVRNFSSRYIEKILKIKPIKLSISSSNLYEQNLTFDVAYRTGKVKNVIWGFDLMLGQYFGNPGLWIAGHNKNVPDFPYYLYSADILSYHKYYLNIDLTIKLVVHLVKTYILRTSHQKLDDVIDDLNNFHKTTKCKEENALKKYAEGIEFSNKSPKLFTQPSDFERIKKQIDDLFLKTIRTHKDVKFIIFFPPYSILLQKYYEKLKLFDLSVSIKEYVITSLINEPNVEIYDFQDDEKITHDLNQYSDMIHYSQDINNYMIDCIRDKKDILSPKDPYQSIKKLKHQIMNYTAR